MIRTLGTTRTEIYAAWERIDKEVSGSPFIVVGFIPGYGTFGWLHGKIIKLYPAYRGAPPTYELAPRQDLEEIDCAILNGTFQVECRPLPNLATDFQTYIYHQATGKPLNEISP